MLYLIEGLDCSGKKAVAAKVQDMLQTDGYVTNIIIGSSGSRIVQKLDKKLVSSYNIKKGSIKDKLRKTVYAIEPVIDGIYYQDNPNTINIKISSHYRAWARAIVEKDQIMVDRFLRFKKKHISYDGVTLLTTDFNTRLSRHRLDVQAGRTNKAEDKRFFHHNKQFFDDWDKEMRNLIEYNISNQLPISTTNIPIDVVAKQVYKRILGIQNAKLTDYIVMLKPDALNSVTDRDTVYNLFVAFANHLLQMDQFPISKKMEMVASEAHQHAYERSQSEKSFMGDTRIVSMKEIDRLLKCAQSFQNQRTILVEKVIVNGITALGYNIINDTHITVSANDINYIYPEIGFDINKQKDIVSRLHDYLDNKCVQIIKVTGSHEGFLLQHWKTFVRHFLIKNRTEKYPLRNLIHVCDGSDYEYINRIAKF